eukprot:3750843-Rhodomonas_salina.2
MRAHNCAVSMRRHVHDTHRAVERANRDAQAVGRDRERGDRRRVLSFEEEVREVERPHTEEAVRRARDAEPVGHDQRVDRSVVQPVDLVDHLVGVVDLIHEPRLRARVDLAREQVGPAQSSLEREIEEPLVPVRPEREHHAAELELLAHALLAPELD